MIANADVMNALVQQNNDISTAIYYATEPEELERAEKTVRLVADLWIALGYAYKVIELRARVIARADELKKQEETYLSNCRKNDKTVSSTKANIQRLYELTMI